MILFRAGGWACPSIGSWGHQRGWGGGGDGRPSQGDRPELCTQVLANMTYRYRSYQWCRPGNVGYGVFSLPLPTILLSQNLTIYGRVRVQYYHFLIFMSFRYSYFSMKINYTKKWSDRDPSKIFVSTYTDLQINSDMDLQINSDPDWFRFR